jgi:hypothetical protein
MTWKNIFGAINYNKKVDTPVSSYFCWREKIAVCGKLYVDREFVGVSSLHCSHVCPFLKQAASNISLL